jgi:hypothetical protein
VGGGLVQPDGAVGQAFDCRHISNRISVGSSRN